MNILRQLAFAILAISWNTSAWAQQPAIENELAIPTVQQNGFYLEIRQIKRSKQVSFGPQTKAAQDDARILLSAFADAPKRVFGGRTIVEIEQIVDENGQSLNSGHMAGFISSDSQSTFGKASMELPFSFPAAIGRRIASFKGAVKFTELKRSEMWEVPNILERIAAGEDITKTVVVDGIRRKYRVASARKSQFRFSQIEEYHISIFTSFIDIASGKPYVHQRNDHTRRIDFIAPLTHLLDAQDRAFLSNSINFNNSFDIANAPLTFTAWREQTQDSVAPGKFIMEIPTEIEEITLPFEFTNLPLP